MALRILVLHGPNLPLLAEREAGMSLDALDEALRARARELGADVEAVRSQHEGGLLEALATHGARVDGVVVSPGVLGHTSYALREALLLVDKPAVEVQLVAPSKGEPWRERSLLEDAVEARRVGGGLEAYVGALEDLVGVSTEEGEVAVAAPREGVGRVGRRAPRSGGKTLGRRMALADGALAHVPSRGEVRGKTLGRHREAAEDVGLTRSQVRERIAARLTGGLSGEELVAWARARWLEVQGGAAVEPGQRELVERSLEALALSRTAKGRLQDERLVEMMAELER